MSEKEYVGHFIVEMFKDINTMVKEIDESDNAVTSHLKADNIDLNSRILFLGQMITDARVRETLVSMRKMGEIIYYLSTVIDKKPDKLELDRIRQSFEKKFNEQQSNISETIKPLSDEIKKTLERQERNKEVYK